MSIDDNVKKLIDEIIENFDFDKCNQMMKLTNWTWWGTGVPTVEVLKNSALERINSAINLALERPSDEDIHIPNFSGKENSFFCSSGGLKATVWCVKKDIKRIDLEFIFTDWSTECD